jgi:hypothetical protein
MNSLQIPEKFASILCDFANDLTLTFPEYEFLWSRWRVLDQIPDYMIKSAYVHCVDIFPERFFDILYQNDEIFAPTSTISTIFLPNVDFKLLFNCPNVSESSKNVMWKYIQLILFTIVGNVNDKNDFGKTMNLFEGIDETELQSKLSDAMKNMSDFFKNSSSDENENPKENSEEGNPSSKSESESENFFEKMSKEFENENFKKTFNADNLPNPEDIHNHLKGLFDGKLGNLAKELIDELSDELKDTFDMKDMDETTNPKELFQKMMRNPDKFMKIIKKINEKFQDKMKKGDISQEEIMKEAGEMLKKMKEMGGNSKQMNEMFQNMAKSMGQSVNKNMKVDTNAMSRMMKSQDIKERLRSKLEQKKNYELQSVGDNHLVYRPLDVEKGEKSLLLEDVQVPVTKEKEKSLDELVAYIEGPNSTTTSTQEPNNKKKNKAKKKK